MALTPEEMYENEKRWIQESYLKKRGRTHRRSGLFIWLSLIGVVVVIGSIAFPQLVDEFGEGIATLISFLISAIGFVIWAWWANRNDTNAWSNRRSFDLAEEAELNEAKRKFECRKAGRDPFGSD